MPCHFIFVEPPSIFIYQSLVIVVNKCTIGISFSVQFSPLTDTVGKDFEISIFSKAVNAATKDESQNEPSSTCNYKKVKNTEFLWNH